MKNNNNYYTHNRHNTFKTLPRSWPGDNNYQFIYKISSRADFE